MGFISDLLIEITSFRIRVGNKLNKLWEDIGNKANLTTTDKSNLVNAINEVRGSIPNVTNLVPYTGANQPINLNTQKIIHNGIVSNVNSITSPWLSQNTVLTANNKVAYLIIDGFIANTHRQLYIEVESIAGNGEYKRLVKGFNINFANTNIIASTVDSRYLEVTGYTGARYGIGEVEKHSDTALKIPLIWIASSALSINKISVKAYTGSVSNLTFSIEYDATSTLTTENPYLYRNASEKWVKDNYDFRQYGLGTEAVLNTGLLENINETGFYAFSTNQQGFNFPRAMMMKRGSQNYGLIFQNSGNKVGFLAGDGSTYTAWHSGNFNPSDYALVSQLPTVNNGQLSLSTGTGLSGSGTFTANQSGNSSFSISIASTHKLPSVAEFNNTLKKNQSNIVTEDFAITNGYAKIKVVDYSAIHGEIEGESYIDLATDDSFAISYNKNDGKNFEAHVSGIYGKSTYNWYLIEGTGTSRMLMPETGNSNRVLTTGVKVGDTTYYANNQGIIELPTTNTVTLFSKIIMENDYSDHETFIHEFNKLYLFLNNSLNFTEITIDPVSSLVDGSEIIIMSEYSGTPGYETVRINGPFVDAYGTQKSFVSVSRGKWHRYTWFAELGRFMTAGYGIM